MSVHNGSVILRIIKFIILSLIIFCVIANCRIFDDRIESTVSQEIKYYKIDPGTILSKLDQGNTDVFTLLKATPQVLPTTSPDLISLKQEDYYRVAQAFSRKYWQEPINESNLYVISFQMDCSDATRGIFTEAGFESFYIVGEGEEETRIEYSITIRPKIGILEAIRKEYRPNVYSWYSMGYENYIITAEEALQIAEQNGGAEKRVEIKNACYIDVLAPGRDGKGWRVIYGNLDRIGTYFEIAIDPQDGSFRILYKNFE
jgi:hypothetical protein